MCLYTNVRLQQTGTLLQKQSYIDLAINRRIPDFTLKSTVTSEEMVTAAKQRAGLLATKQILLNW